MPASHRVPLRDLPVWDRIAPAIGEVAEAVILGATLRDPATRPLPEHDGPRLFGYDPADRLGQLVLPEMLREHLLHLRWIFGFSYATLSAAFGVPVDVVQAWEKGEAMPEPAQYGLLGEAADVLGLVAKGAFLSRNTLQRFLARYDVDRLAHDGLLFRVIVREITPRASDPYTRNSWYSGTAAQREERQMFAERHRAVQTFLDAADGDHATAHTTIAKVVTQSQRVLQQAVVEAIEELGVDSSDLADVVTVPDPEYADVDLVVRAPQGTWEALAEREDELQEAVQRRVDASGRHVLAAFLTIGAARVRVTV